MRLDDLKRAAADLQAPTDILNSRLEEVERILIELKLGVSASVALPPGPEELRFGKENGKWGLYIDMSERAPYQPHSQMPLLNAPRRLRILAAMHLTAMVEELINEASRALTEVSDANNTLDELIEELKRASL